MENPAVATFLQEAREILEGLESQLLDLEAAPSAEGIDAVFRALHTIKGSGAMFGFGALARFTHHFEDAFDRLRTGRITVDPGLIGLSLRARDRMLALLEQGGETDEAEESRALISALAGLTGSPTQARPDDAPPPQDAAEAAPRLWKIHFRPEATALRNGMRPDLLIAELAAMGDIDVTLDASRVPPLEDLVPDESLLGWTILLSTRQSRAQIEAVFLFADEAELAITQPAPAQPSDPATAPRGTAPTPPPDRAGETIRIPAARLDEIMDRLGELVIAQAHLQRIADSRRDPDLATVVEEMDRLVTGLRDAALSTRMLPIETVFGKFRRVVRDLSTDLGKQVRLLTEGGETEIDKTVIDRLSEPLVHMIRNSMDHGIEPSDARLAAGKPPLGTIRLSARQDGGEVLITLEDDGRGLDTAALRRKGIERGLLPPDADPPAEELHHLIFAPGFSTAERLSSVSGRGVGMDAVRSAVDALRGRIEVASRPGFGTRITLCLPVTLAIIDGLLVRLGRTVCVIPLAAVEECVEFNEDEGRRDSGRTMLQLRDDLIPFLDLDMGCDPAAEAGLRRRVVCLRVEGSRVGLIVDDVLGRHQTVIKTFSIFHRDLRGFAGATILGDGTVALIIDVATLLRPAAGADTGLASSPRRTAA
ncbi:chemotaxis protein CheA [Tabrizicola sp. TH137]|uniref:chemotaxis protein CheA n=1 Tax=Tabrizicola sp. TH137 TaxID=2067452 RepID=UPI000C7DD1A9|nr:chemotaxis protein CheA [Tabrizicola sp. TH137]PLL10873.1 chemotaxis protein CheA [Tabrizicola sp. TH137]